MVVDFLRHRLALDFGQDVVNVHGSGLGRCIELAIAAISCTLLLMWLKHGLVEIGELKS